MRKLAVYLMLSRGEFTMKKRLSILLTICILLSCAAPSAWADAPEMAVSEKAEAYLIRWEGYNQYAYRDADTDSIGYGTNCDPADYPNGVTREEALEMMRLVLAEIAGELNEFGAQNGLVFTQNQFDALACFTYNVGGSWMKNTTRIARYLMTGSTPLEFLNALGVWCHVGNTLYDTLARRRIDEYNMYMYGDYDGLLSSNVSYFELDPAGGQVTNDSHFFFCGTAVGQLPAAVRSGYTFLKWTDANGAEVNENTVCSSGGKLTAQWVKMDETEEKPKPPVVQPVYVNPYKDVQESDWFYQYVADLSRNGIINGYPDSTFRPMDHVTNGQALKLILLAAGYREQAAIPGQHWASGYYSLAVDAGVLAAQPMDLDAPMNRLTIAGLAASALGLRTSMILSPFVDTNDPSVLALNEAGIITGSYDSAGRLQYCPEKNITRAELSAVIWRINRYKNEQNPATPPVTASASGNGLPWGLEPIEGVPLYSYDSSCFYSQGGIKYYNTGTAAAAVGIDVSEHQGTIDWKKVADQGVQYAMVRVGYRGYSDGGIYADKRYQENIEGALAAGLRVGVYFFSQAITAQEALEEAVFTLEAIQGYDISYPVAFDWENISGSWARTDGITTHNLCAAANTFCALFEQCGYHTIVYFNTYIGLKLYDLSQIMRYDFWYAGYTAVPNFYYDFDMWQYWDSGRLDGIDEKVDMNLCFKQY